MHIMPEAVEDYSELHEEDESNGVKVFPLPYLIFFCGYTLILVIDRVLFDSHALFEDDHHGGHTDPAEEKLMDVAKKSVL